MKKIHINSRTLQHRKRACILISKKNKAFGKYPVLLLVLLSALIGFFNIGCNKYLDSKQNQQLEVPTTIGDLQALLDNNGVTNTRGSSWDQASSDDYFLTDAIYNSLSLDSRNAYIWDNKAVAGYPNEWSRIYDAVLYANTALDGLVKIPRTQSNKLVWDNVQGSALFFRSYAFFKGLLLYSPAYNSVTSSSDLGIVLKLSSDITKQDVRSSVEEGYRKVVVDLLDASRLLPDLPQQVMRPSKAAAFGELARVFLSMGIYDSCYLYADSALAIKNDLMDYNNLAVGTTATPFARFNTEVVFHATTQSFAYLAAYPVNARVDSLLLLSYDDNDLRKKLFFASKTDGKAFRGSYGGSANYLFQGVATDEIVLTKAEAAIRIGRKKEAIAEMNYLLEHRWKSGTYTSTLEAMSDDAILDTILIERKKELLFRGIRWIDIKRLNESGVGSTLSRYVNGNYYYLPPLSNKSLLPIPQDIVNLTGIVQNP